MYTNTYSILLVALWFLFFNICSAAVCFPDRLPTLRDAIAALPAESSGVAYTYAADGVDYGNIEDWCFDPSITDFSFLLYFKPGFNADISGWNTEQIKSMEGMLLDARSFDQPLNQWSVGNVTNMRGMFDGARAFNQPLHRWSVGNVTDMVGMFSRATLFNQNLGAWGPLMAQDPQPNTTDMFTESGCDSVVAPTFPFTENLCTNSTSAAKATSAGDWLLWGPVSIRAVSGCFVLLTVVTLQLF